MKIRNSLTALILSLAILVSAASFTPAVTAADRTLQPVSAAVDNDSIASAAVKLREQIKLHKPEITGTLKLKKISPRDAMTLLYDKVFEYNSVADEGDYLEHSFDKIQYGFSYLPGTTITLNFTYNVTYRITYSQEQTLTERINELLPTLGLDGKTQSAKARIIHDYIAKNVAYDHVHLGDDTYLRQFTAYAALIDGTSVCEGYALLFYRMAMQAGLSVRLISGDVKGEAHAWNIVKIGDLYYNLDATFSSTANNYTSYFLKGTNNFTDHVADDKYNTAEFKASFPISPTDYDESGESSAQETESTAATQEATDPPTEPTQSPSTEPSEAETGSETTGNTESSTEKYTETESVESQTQTPTQPVTESREDPTQITETSIYINEDSTEKSTQKPAEVQPVVSGDVNGDGRVSIEDATQIGYYLIKVINLSDIQKEAADVNGDGVINVTDITTIQKYLVLLIPGLG